MDRSTISMMDGNNETMILQQLLDVFGDSCSLEDIAAAYCKSQGDVDVAGDILFRLQQSIHCDSREQRGESADSANVDDSCKDKPWKESYQMKDTASMGNIPIVVGRNYARSSVRTYHPFERTKPPKIVVEKSWFDNCNERPGESNLSTREDFSNRELENFLFMMLGDGFKLSMDVIREVLGTCGYDLKKSMEELLTYSQKKGKSGTVVDQGASNEETEEKPAPGYTTSPPSNFDGSSFTSQVQRSSQSQEVLESLFIIPHRREEELKEKRVVSSKRRQPDDLYLVRKPFDDLFSSTSKDVQKEKPAVVAVENNEDNYMIFRRTAKSNWDAMKSYYEAAIDAFTEGNHAKVNYLLEQGNHYNLKAREADEKSALEIIKAKEDEEKTVSLDLRDMTAKEAWSLLKLHLGNLGAIPFLADLKANFGTDCCIKRDNMRRKILARLDKESVKWVQDGEDPGTIIMNLDSLDRSKLSFVKN